MSETTLKPCPFCGAKSPDETGQPGPVAVEDLFGDFHIHCLECDIEAVRFLGFEHEAAAIAAWNTRVEEKEKAA